MGEKKSGRKKGIALVIVGMVLGAVLITPAGAHISTVAHTWKKHFLPLAKKAFYTKKQSNQIFVRKKLPVGQTVRGTWGIGGNGSSFDMWESINYPTPLANAPESHWLAAGAAPTTDCPGTPANPKAAPGHLCVYTTTQTFLGNTGIYGGGGSTEGGSDRFGAVLWSRPNPAGASAFAWGTWAVTAGSASTTSLSTGDGGDGPGH